MGSRQRFSGLWSIVYHSRIGTPLSEVGLSRLAIHAQTRNETLGITGILFLANPHFVQILEGDRAPVTWLYRMIAADPRHRNVVKVLDGPIEQRAFEGWFMRLLTADDISEPERAMVLNTLRLSGDEWSDAEAPSAVGLPGLSPFLASALTTGVLRPPAGRYGPRQIVPST